MIVAPTASNVATALRSFLLSVLPAGVEVVAGQVNRVPEPIGLDYVVFWPIRRERIETNIDASEDVSFTASIAGTTMTVSAVAFGIIAIGSTVFGTAIAPGTIILAQLGGTPGGVGSYKVSGAPQIVASTEAAAGTTSLTQPTKITYQLDVHGPAGGDNAQIISTTFRDDYAVVQFAGQIPAYDVVPLLADDPRQMPFINDQNQVETRWVVEAVVQANQAIEIPQQYADTLVVGLIDVDAVYPP